MISRGTSIVCEEQRESHSTLHALPDLQVWDCHKPDCPTLAAEMLDQIHCTLTFSKLHIWIAYNLIQIKVGDEDITASLIHDGQFDYATMPFTLTNVSATFLTYCNNCLQPHIGDYDIGYLDDMLI
jgi:hypothetical protein